MNTPLHIVLGTRDGDTAAVVRRALKTHPSLLGHPLHWHLAPVPELTPSAARDAAQAARLDQGVVVAVGGDGTVNAACHACCQLGVPLGVLPHGTFNYFGRQQQLGASLDEGLAVLGEALRTGQRRPVTVGEVNGHTFVVNASLGLYPRMLAEREVASRELGRHRVVALLAGLLSLLRPYRAKRLSLIEHDGLGNARERVALSSTLFVGLNGLQLERVGVPQAKAAGQGQLVVTTLAPRGPLAMLGVAWAAFRQRITRHPAVESFTCRALSVEPLGRRASHTVMVAFDGERRRLNLPLRFGLRPEPLWLVAPSTPVPLGATPSAAQPAEALSMRLCAAPVLARGLI